MVYMTHFTVLIVCPENIKNVIDADVYVEKALAPYDENLSADAYIKDVYADRITKHRAAIGTYYLMSGKIVHYNPQAVLQKLDQIANMSAEEYFEYEAGDAIRDEHKNVLSTYNPNSRWDWYSYGGRWADFISLKEANGDIKNNYIFQLSNFDFKGYEEKVKLDRNAEYDVAVKDPNTRGKFGYVDSDKISKEDYVNSPIPPFFTTCAVVVDGEWKENGKTGMFGSTYDEVETQEEWENKFYDRFIKNLSPDTYLALIDCHI